MDLEALYPGPRTKPTDLHLAVGDGRQELNSTASDRCHDREALQPTQCRPVQVGPVDKPHHQPEMRDYMDNETKPPRLGNLADAADRMGVSERTVRRMINRGELPAYRVGKRLIRVDLDELEASIKPIPTEQRRSQRTAARHRPGGPA